MMRMVIDDNDCGDDDVDLHNFVLFSSCAKFDLM